jgi:transcriptional regulator with XRE-family HTH domain
MPRNGRSRSRVARRPVKTERPDQVVRDVGRRIAEVREHLGLTQQEASERLAMPLKNLQLYESGKNMMIATAVRIARGLGVPTRSLFDEPRSRTRRPPGRPKRSTK